MSSYFKKTLTILTLLVSTGIGLVVAVPSLSAQAELTLLQSLLPNITSEENPSAPIDSAESDSQDSSESNLSADTTVTPVPNSQDLIFNELQTNFTDSQFGLALEVSPARIGDDYSLTLEPGSARTFAIQLTNPTNQTIEVFSSVQDFVVGGEDGETPILVSQSTNSTPYARWALSPWITLSTNHLLLQPQETVELPVTINVPADARPGGHYAMILHRLQDSHSDSYLTLDPNLTGLQTFSQVIPQIGQLIYVVVPGESLNGALEIIDFRFDTLRETGPLNYQFSLKNSSNYHTHPSGQITVTNIFDHEVATFPIDSEQNMFPETIRQYHGTWQKNWGFGPYTATLTLNYGQSQNQASATHTFWLIPVRLVILIILVLACSVVVIYNYRHQKSGKQQKSSHVQK